MTRSRGITLFLAAMLLLPGCAVEPPERSDVSSATANLTPSVGVSTSPTHTDVYTVKDMKDGEVVYGDPEYMWVDENGRYRLLTDSAVSRNAHEPDAGILRIERRGGDYHVWLTPINSAPYTKPKAEPPHDGRSEGDYVSVVVH